MEPALDKQSSAAGLDVEARAGVEAELGLRIVDAARNVVTLHLEVVYPPAADQIWAKFALFGRLELVDDVGGAVDQLKFHVRRRVVFELAPVAIDLNPHRPVGRHHRYPREP